MTAADLVATVVDPELPMLTLADLGVLRDVVECDGRVEVTLTPTYLGCPALGVMRADIERVLARAGYREVSVVSRLDPPWSSDDITQRGRERLAAAGISPPLPRPDGRGPVVLGLGPVRRAVVCPRCGSGDTELLSEFGATACKALYRCRSCAEPFDHVKEH